MSSAEYHPEHDRTSCSDEHPINVDPEGSTGCARCTAIHLDQGAEAIQHLRALLNSGSVIAGAEEHAARKMAQTHWNGIIMNTTSTALTLLREIYDDVIQGAIPNLDDPWWAAASAALAAPAQAVPAPGAIATMLEGLRHARKVLNHHNLALECGPVNIAIAAASAPAAPAKAGQQGCA